ncbi:MAG: hypothetical protein ACI4XJ_08465 [Eubacteriales bacterium]
MVDGFMEPVEIRGCENLILSGLKIDHKRKPYSAGKITEIDKENRTIIVKFGEKYAINENMPIPRFALFDLERNRLYDYGNVYPESCRMIADQTLEFTLNNVKDEYKGMTAVLWHTFHSRPAILIEDSSNIKLENVIIHSQPGMGIVAHHSNDLEFKGLQVVPSTGEPLSTNTDATHITSCTGTVVYENCVFEAHGDDALNIHTYYHTIRHSNGNKCVIHLDAPTGTHSSSADYFEKGDVIELTDAATLEVVDKYTVVDSSVIDPYESELTLDRNLPGEIENFFISNASRCPHLIYRGNYSRNHIARGILIKTKSAVVENNTFVDIVGTAIYVAAESGWREGICSTDEIIIRNNRIVTCGRTSSARQFDTAGICVTVDCKNRCAQTHKKIVIEDNSIYCPHSPNAIYVSNTQTAEIHRNTVVSGENGIITENCGKLSEDDNIFCKTEYIY